jgi:hypothetical protein
VREPAADAAHPAPLVMGHPSATPTVAPPLPAQTIGTTLKPGTPGPMADRLQLLIRREFLIADLREAKRLHRERSSIEAELRRVTLRALAI